MRHVTLVVPCFNEEHRLDRAAFDGARLEGHDLNLVFVDDGSTDGTRGVLEALRARHPQRVRVVVQPVNGGKAEAVRRGVLVALEQRPDAVGFWDADLATPLAELPPFVRVLEENPEIEVVIGSRVKLMGRHIQRRLWRHYLGRIFATAASMALEMPVYDTQCGTKLFRVTPAVARVFAEPFLARWVFDVEILARFLAYHGGTRSEAQGAIYELPLGHWVDVHGTKLKAGDFAKAAVDLAMLRARYGGRSSLD
jgi:glycosyltransferase involved in cell wall biosynthesis